VFLGITYLDGDSTEIPANPTEMIKKVAQKTQEVVVGKVPDRTTVLMFVIDKEYDDVTGEYLYPRTDSIVLANYDNVNKRLSMMSIPRDTIVEVSDDMYNKLCAEFPEPGKKQMKINAIYHYAGEKHGMEYLKEEITRIFGVDPDYCVCVNFEGFNYIVDSIGGVEFEVPIDMVYDDPAQDLHINLKAGKQVLDGDKAQQFVRYRKDNYGNGYAGGDIERIAVQQAFLKVLMNKALSSETVFKNIFAYFNAFNKYVKTDASINDMARYATVLKSINMNDVITETLPGEPAYIYGISGYRVNESEAAALVYNTFVKPLNEIKKELGSQQSEEGVEKSTDKRIKVLNGGYTEGLAGEIQNRFAEKGISVLSIGTYNGEKTSETRIYVSKEGEGLDLVKCFDKTATVITDSTKTAEEECDILVIVGTEEPLVRQNVSQTTPSGSVPLTLNIISSGGQDTDVQQPAVDSGRDYTDYDFDDEDDEDDEDGEEYSYDDTEEEEEDTDDQSYDDEEEEEKEEDYSGSDD
ncbi:MAG: LCP family protein, partial [Firmicutes bacterium]|nr:LCP family protein [Bacillota bacterium]